VRFVAGALPFEAMAGITTTLQTKRAAPSGAAPIRKDARDQFFA
jgi:hypothetical protein